MSEENVQPVGDDQGLVSKLWSDDSWQDLKLGRYQLKSLLGAGGMGRVFLARDNILQRDVALKTIPEAIEEAHESGQLEQFLREAQAVAQLEHPNVACVYDVVHQEGVIGIAMEYVQGRSLQDVINAGEKLSFQEICNCGKQ